jgi:hypothetical protein
MNNDTNTLGIRRNEMDATLVHLFSHTKDYVAKNVNNKVLAFVNQIESELNKTKKELAAFKKNNEELIQRHNAAVSSWDEERERALREADRAIEYKEKYEDLVKDIRLIGKQIFCSTGGTFENDPPDAIMDAVVRALNDKKPERVEQLNSIIDGTLTSWKKQEEEMKLSHDKTLESLRYNIERTAAFEALAEMLYKAGYDNIDAIKKIYEIVREKYPAGAYWMPSKSV